MREIRYSASAGVATNYILEGAGWGLLDWMVYEVVDSSAREINATNDGWPQHEIGTGTGTGPGGTGAGTGTGPGGTGTRTEPELERDLKRELDGRTCCLTSGHACRRRQQSLFSID